jgi:branched-chain amino acid transport system ATP-binding protein
VTVRFGGLAAVSDVDLAVPPAATVGLVGPNGAGKSTLFGVLSGLLRPTQGKVFLDGEDITGSRPQRRSRRGLARTFQHPELFTDLTVRDHLVLAHRVKHARRRIWTDLVTMGSLHRVAPEERASVDELIEVLGLTPVARRPALGLPLGQARLLELGRALASSPTVLLLDEPSSGLDSSETAQFESTLLRICTERSISMLLVEHDVDLVMRMCGSVYVLDFGQLIASGSPEEVRSDPAVRAAYLGDALPADRVGTAAGGTAGPDPALTRDAVTAVDASPADSLGAATPDADALDADALDAEELDADASDADAPSAGLVRSAPRRHDAEPPPLLEVNGLGVRYGEASALTGLSFSVRDGTVLAVLGANGAGKSTLARALSGLVRPCAGRVVFAGKEIAGWPAYRIRRAGLVYLPESRGIFGTLNVMDNLRMAAAPVDSRRARRQVVERSLEIFPVLADRRRQRADRLSGGEQQMLSMAVALVEFPKLLIADEVSLGLAPMMVDLVFEGLVRARQAGVTVIMIEQYVHRALAFADDCMVLQRGELAWSGPAATAHDEILGRYLGEAVTAAD